MLLRGLKRKYETGEEDPESESYRSSLRHFQNVSRRRESMRIKTRNEVGGELSAVLELEKRLGVENSLLGGVEKFLREPSQGFLPCLEAAKTLKTSQLRRDMLKYELNKLKRGQGRPCGLPTGGGSSLAGLSLSQIRIPLSLPERSRLRKPGSHAVFCIARIGSQIYDTGLLYPVEPGSTADISFEEDLIFFSRVPHYFELLIEVYSCHVPNVTSSNETHRKIARSISRVVGKSLLKRGGGLFGSLTDNNNAPKFELIATANLTLEDCSNDVGTNELYVEDLNGSSHSNESVVSSESSLPLFGSLCCHLAARPYCCEEEVFSGSLTLMHQKRASSSSTTKKVWGSLMDWKLSLWGDHASKEAGKASLIEIPVNRESTITDKRGNLQIRNEQVLWEFCFQKENVRLSQWFAELSQHASNHRKWKQAASMKVASPGTEEQLPSRSFKRTRSKLVLFYNDV